jgi:putative transposase
LLIDEVAPVIGTLAACAALGMSRATTYRQRLLRKAPPAAAKTRASHRALGDAERDHVLAVLARPEHANQAVAQVYAELLDRSIYLCSMSTMYRILKANGAVRERRDQLRHPNYKKPELLATQPNQVWSWDITKLLGPAKWTYYYLYVLMDIFSRYVVGWMVASRETADLGAALIAEACERQGIQQGQLTIHADRGSPMTAKSTALLFADLGVGKSHSRPHVSNDNPYSEGMFKTVKYHPDFPGRFGSQQDARTYSGPFFHWYNEEHRHSSLALLTPSDVHHGRGGQILAARDRVLDSAFATNPQRFVNQRPVASRPPVAAWINKPLQVHQLDDIPAELCSAAQ